MFKCFPPISSLPPIQIWLPCMDTPRAQQLFWTRHPVPKISHYTRKMQSRIANVFSSCQLQQLLEVILSLLEKVWFNRNYIFHFEDQKTTYNSHSHSHVDIDTISQQKTSYPMSNVDSEECKLAIAGIEASSRLQEDKHQLNVCCFALVDTSPMDPIWVRKTPIFLHLKENF